MKTLLALLALIPISTWAQFGFHQDTSSTTVKVFKNGSLQANPWAGGLDFCQYSNVDLDLDGVQDLIVFDRTCDKVLTFLQKGAPGVVDYEYAPSYEKVFEALSPKLYGWLLMADYDGDGKQDLFSTAPGGGVVYRNVSTSTTGLSFELETSSLPSVIYYNGNAQTSAVYANQFDIPAIVDVDGDGDLDVLSFYLGSCVRYYKNLCQETYGHSDSLFFETVNVCYGTFEESSSSNVINLNTCCPLQVDDPESTVLERPATDNQDRHAGSTLLALDLDADEMMDLVIGDVSFNNLTMLMNGSSVPNTNVVMVSQDNAYPSYDTPVDLSIYPGAFYVDVNNDQIRDLLVSPAVTTNAENVTGNWFYLNEGADDFPDFEFQQNDFLQGEMIDYGTGSLPVFFDHNSDGLLDLLVSIEARFLPTSGNNESKIAYYENTGTATVPEFTFVTDDYQNLSSLNGGGNLHLYPTFGDLSGDGAAELLLAEYDGDIWIYANVSGPGNPAIFGNQILLKDQNGDPIDEGLLSVPKLVDLDRDGLLDLVIGKKNGKLAYYHNVGTAQNYAFSFVTDELGGVDVSESWSTVGRAIPEFVDVNDTFHLVVGSSAGYLSYYRDIENNLTGVFDLVDASIENIYIGEKSAPTIADLDGDNKLEMILGNQRGGLALFESAIVTDIGVEEINVEIGIYPNPAEHYFNIDLSQSYFGIYHSASYVLYDMTGRQMMNAQIGKANTVVNCDHLSKGIYILNVKVLDQTITKKIIIE